MAAGRNSSFFILRRLLPFLKPYRYWVLVKLLSTTLNAANDIFLVYVMNMLVNSSLAGDRAEMTRSISFMLVSVAIGIFVNFMETYSSGRYSASAARDLRNAFGIRIDKLPISFIEARHSGDFSSRMSNGITAIESFFGGDLAVLLFHILRMSVSVLLMLFMNGSLLLLCMIILPLMALLTNTIGRPLNEYSSRLQRTLAKTNTAAQETISGIHTIKSYNLVQVLFLQFKALLHQLLSDSLRIEKRRAAMASVSVFVQTAPFLLFFLAGGYLVIKGHFTAGGLVSYAMLLNYLVNGMGHLPDILGNCRITAGVAEHLFEIIDAETERTDGGRPEIPPSAPALEFRQVSFSYDGNLRVLDDISFTLPQGQTVALVGASGSGKTTVFKLIAGFYGAYGGCIRLFGEPLSNWELSYARSQISMVSQETFLFSGTLKENITCGNGDCSMEEVEKAARLANIHDYIQSLPEGYDSLAYERGAKLSGGQRQRISIARAILKDAPILLLDEATSALDTESEMLVQEAIKRVMKDKTVLVVAHRLSTIIDSDCVLVMDNGRIVERGTHHELLAQDGVYSRLYRKQLHRQEESRSLPEGKGG